MTLSEIPQRVLLMTYGSWSGSWSGSWIGAAFPTDAAGQASPYAVNRHERASGIAKGKQQPVPQRNFEIGCARDVQAECRSRTEKAGNQCNAGTRTALPATYGVAQRDQPSRPGESHRRRRDPACPQHATD